MFRPGTTLSCAFVMLIGVTGQMASAGQTPPAAPAGGSPAAAAPETVAPADYVVGPEDVLGVLFWREPEISGDVVVRPDGIITLPLIGEMRAAGLRPEALRDQIQKAAAKYLTEVNVTVLVRQINSRKVFITGQVRTPGSYPLTGPRTVMQLIALAGGVTEYADFENIAIMREEQGRTRSIKFNYKEVAKGRKLEQNIQLLPGDTVIVR